MADSVHQQTSQVKEFVDLSDDPDMDVDFTDLNPSETGAFDNSLLADMSELKPRLDTIFADVQTSIPSLDFEASSVSSDEEVSIFNRSLKTPRSERELQDDALTPEAWRKALEPFNEIEDIPVQAPTYEYVKVSQESGAYRGSMPFKSSMPKVVEADDTSPRIFTRRIKMSTTTASKEDRGLSFSSGLDLVPKDMIPSIEEFDDVDESLENSNSSLQDVISSVVVENFGLDSADSEEVNFEFDFSVEDGIIEVSNDDDHSGIPSTILQDSVSKPSENGLDNRTSSDTTPAKRKSDDDTTHHQHEKDDIITQMMIPKDAPTLAIEKVDFIDLDLLIDAFPERSNVTNSSSLVAPSEKGDGGTEENASLMDKLTQLCIQQSGGQISKADLSPAAMKSSSAHPRRKATGMAAKPPRSPPKVVWEDKKHPSRVDSSSSTNPPNMSGGVSMRTTSTGTSMGTDLSTTDMGANTDRRMGVGRRVQLTRETVYLDLRTKETENKDTTEPSKAVQRILQLHANKTESSSSDESSDDEDSAMGWHEKRRKVMQQMSQVKGQSSTQGGESAVKKQRDVAGDTEPVRKSVFTPHRVIHIVHDEESSSRESGTQTLPVKKMFNASVTDLPPTPPQSPADQGSGTPQRRSSLTETQSQTDTEYERNVEIAQKLREQKEQDRQARQKFQKKLVGLHSQMTISRRRKEVAKSTDILFDVEASYKPDSAQLPPNLTPQHETLLLTVAVTTSGAVLLNKSSGRQLLDRADGQISATYMVLVSWLLSLVPSSLDYLTNPAIQAQCVSSGTDGVPFRVVGLQQIWKDNKLQLLVAITPNCMDSTKHTPLKSKKAKLREEVRDMSPFQQTVSKFLTSKNLHTLAPWMLHAFRYTQEFSGEPLELPPTPYDTPREGANETGTYIPPYPQVSGKPLATFVTMTTLGGAVDGAFSTPASFFWRTLDSDETVYDQLTNDDYNNNTDMQNTLTVLHPAIYQHPSRSAGVLYRLLQEGLDLAGFRLVYNSSDLLNNPRSPAKKAPVEVNRSHLPVVVMAIRGNMARTRWLDAVGPSDPALAKRTDPYSLMAFYGGNSRDDLTIVCPRNPSRINYELSLWFGARVSNSRSPEAVLNEGSLQQSSDKRGHSESARSRKGRKGSRKDSWSGSSNEDLDCVGLPAASLIAVTIGDVILVVSPLVPPVCLGMILSTCQERGYQFRGVKRVRLNARRAAALGLQGKQVSIFSPMSCSTPTSPKNCEEALRKQLEAGLPASTNPPLPSSLIHLRAENAMRNVGGLVYTLMVQLSRQGLLSSIQSKAETNLKSAVCFHVTPFSETLLQSLGGDFSRIPEHDTYHGVSVPSTFYSNPELEQIVVVTFSGAKTLKVLGNTLSKLLGVYPVTSTCVHTTPVVKAGEGLELLGIKFLPCLTTYQAKELTPFEVGDRSWQPSLHSLVSNPAVVSVLRGINAFHHVRTVLGIPTHPNDFRRGAKRELSMERLMSASAEIAFRQAAMFFRDHELFADPSMRANLPYQPPLRSPSLEELSNARFAWAEDHAHSNKKAKYRGAVGQKKGVVLVEESIFKTMLAGPRPITTVLLIKPGAIKHLSKILKRICHEDFTVVAMRLLMLNNRQMRALVPDKDADNPIVTSMHLDHLKSGPVLALALQRENAVRKLLNVLGPANPKEAKKQNEFLWRGMFGADPINNAFHGSETYAKSVEEQKLLFPEGLCCRLTSDLKADKIPCPAVDSTMGLQLASKRSFMLKVYPSRSESTDSGIVSPSTSSISMDRAKSPSSDIGVGTSPTELSLPSHSALCQTNCIVLTPPLQLLSVQGHRKGYVDVMDCLRQRGFEVIGARMVWFNQSQAKEFVSIYSGAYPNLVQLLCHGPSIVLAIQRDNAVSCFGSLLGNILDKDSVINKYGKHILRPKNTKEAIKHLEFFFSELMPDCQGEIASEDSSMGFLTV